MPVLLTLLFVLTVTGQDMTVECCRIIQDDLTAE